MICSLEFYFENWADSLCCFLCLTSCFSIKLHCAAWCNFHEKTDFANIFQSGTPLKHSAYLKESQAFFHKWHDQLQKVQLPWTCKPSTFWLKFNTFRGFAAKLLAHFKLAFLCDRLFFTYYMFLIYYYSMWRKTTSWHVTSSILTLIEQNCH